MEEARGSKVVIRFDARKCIHSRHCVLEAPEVFQANVQGPWIQPDQASVEKVVRVALACPSGAITYERLDSQPQEAAPAVNAMRVRENGPLAIQADLRIGKHFLGYRATLCRCGQSANKPFCDGAHSGAGFTASGEPASGKTDMLPHRGGVLEVTPVPNGPLQVDGNLEICSGTGRVVARTTQTWLCRCGASENKPFCDGSHKKTGFRAD
jgi:CDGSH-type Zn-finger protein/uncharacterized Fe-S cluster protein YjdI